MINNDIEFMSVFADALENATEYVMGKILTEYKQLIQKIVYDAYDPIQYQRTGGMLDSWVTKVNDTALGAEGILEQDTDSLTLNEDLWQHGTPWQGDLRNYVTDMIYQGYGYASDPLNLQNRPYSQKRDAWAPLIDELNNGMLDRLFKEGIKVQGLDIRGWGQSY